MSGWDQYTKRQPTELEIEEWSTWPGAGVGLCLGEVSGIIALDFDNNISGVHERILSLLPPSYIKKTGAKGHTAFYRYNGEKSFKKSINNESVIELLSTGRQTVLPPSIHPSGVPYKWISVDTLEHINPAELEILPENFLQLIEQFFPDTRKITKIHENRISSYYGETSPEEVRQALLHIPADDYELWVQIGMGLKFDLGMKGYDLWNEWSGKSQKYKPEEMPRKWNGFNSQGVGIGTIFYNAMQNGYVPKPKYIDIPLVPMDLAPVAPTVSLVPVTEQKRDFSHIVKAPGLVGEITNWIVDTALQPQPFLALAAAIAAVGVVMAHRVRSETDLRTNMLTISLAPSSSGKDHPRKCVIQLLKEAGLSDVHGGTPASGQGLLNSVFTGKGRRLIQIDEFGRLMKNLNARNAASFQADILTNIMMLFSAANNIFHGTEYAHAEELKLKRKDIEQPCLCVHGSSVPGRFYEALSSAEAIDGFLSRWLVFESHDASPQRREDLPLGDPPASLIQKLIEWEKRPTNAYAMTEFEAGAYIKPLIIPFSSEAKAILKRYITDVDARKIAAYKEGQGLDAIYGRAVEHAIKLALCGHTNEIISKDTLIWAIDVAEYCMETTLSSVKNRIADSQNEADIKKVVSILQKHGSWMNHEKLTRRLQWLTRQRRGEILSTLLEMGDIEGQDVQTDGRPRREYRAL